MPMITEKTVRAILPVMLGAVFVLTAETAVDAFANFSHAAPRVGDMMSFAASQEAPTDPGVRLMVSRPDRLGCVLDLDVIRRAGGSLVVEGKTVASDSSFLVHWAGERTTADAGDCGSNTDLVVDAGALDTLAMAAGMPRAR